MSLPTCLTMSAAVNPAASQGLQACVLEVAAGRGGCSVDAAKLPIHGVTPFTLQDFPDHVACVVWFGGCNLRCRYCHNPQLIKAKGEKTCQEVLSFLETRRGKLDGVVLSGGEATLFAELPEFIRSVRQLGFKVKLDTNGLRPDAVRGMLAEGLLDYVALDYKAPVRKFEAVTTVRAEKFSLFRETLGLLCAASSVSGCGEAGGFVLPFEVRTTVHTSLLEETDIELIMKDLAVAGYAGTYYVQNYRADNARPTLGDLPAQERVLDCEKVRALSPEDARFQVAFRNF